MEINVRAKKPHPSRLRRATFSKGEGLYLPLWGRGTALAVDEVFSLGGAFIRRSFYILQNSVFSQLFALKNYATLSAFSVKIL